MMKKIFFACILWPLTIGVNAQSEKKTITFEDVFVHQKFSVKSVPGFNVMKDGKHYTKIDKKGNDFSINKYDLVSGNKVATVFSTNLMTIEHYSFSENEQKLLLFTNSEPIYRRSILYDVYVVESNSSQPKLLFKEKVLHASFNPNGDKVAYVWNNNLYYKDLSTDKIVTITKDGARNSIINGNCDWVYEEEFSFTKAYEWSPNGSYIAYYKFNEQHVKEFTMPKYNGLYPENYTFKYPKAGEDNSIVSIHSYTVASDKEAKMNIGENDDQYIPRIKWTQDNELIIYQLNRLQNELNLLKAQPDTGTSEVIYSEKEDEFIEISDEIYFLRDQSSFIFTSEKSGNTHLYLYNFKSKKLSAITSGSWNVDKLIQVDEVRSVAYFTAGVNDGTQRDFYKIDIKSGKLTQLSQENGWNEVIPSTSLHYFLIKNSAADRVPEFKLIDYQGKVVRTLESNQELKKTLEEYQLGKTIFTTIPNSKNESLNAWIIFPVNFDSTKKYPALLYQYSGPGSQEVVQKFPLGHYFWHQYLANNGYMIVCVDGTGTGGKSEAFKKKTYLKLGALETQDQIDVAKYLQSKNYVAKDRIGIWGWSYGGFISSTALLKGNDVFKTAIAVAPVTNWRYYDNIYTERYMRTPQVNTAGYDDNAPEKMAGLLKGNFLLIHGTGDDNVHFQHAAMLTKELILANKQFESIYYPDGNHGIGGGVIREQLFRKMSNYIFKNL